MVLAAMAPSTIFASWPHALFGADNSPVHDVPAVVGIVICAVAASAAIWIRRRGKTYGEEFETPAAARTTVEGRRTSQREIRGAAQRFASDRRRAAARALLRAELAVLDRTLWHVEPDVILGGVMVPFVVFGPAGVFVLTAAERWVMPDLTVLACAATDLQRSLDSYPDSVHAGICLPFGDREIRSWFDATGAHAVVFGRDRLPEFFGGVRDRGYAPCDIAALRRTTDTATPGAAEDQRGPLQIGRG